MKDLYQNLNLDGPVNDTTLLSEAIGRCVDEETVRAARYVLLNPNRKQFYDCNHRVLSTIGEVRARLALPETQQWALLGNQDFDCDITPAWTDPLDLLDDEDLLDDAAALNQSSHRLPTASLDLTLPLRLAFGGLIALACLALVLFIASFGGGSKTEPLPEHGTVVSSDTYKAAKKTSTITFETPSDAGHYFIKLVSANSGSTLLTVVVREGQKTRVRVARGRYELQISVGEERHWDGERFNPPLRRIENLEFSVPPNKTMQLP